MSAPINAAVSEEIEFREKLESLPFRLQAWVGLRAVLRCLPLAWTPGEDSHLAANPTGYVRDLVAGLLASWAYAVEGDEHAWRYAESAVMAYVTLPDKDRPSRSEHASMVLDCVEGVVDSLVQAGLVAEKPDRPSSTSASLAEVMAKTMRAAVEAEKALGTPGLARGLAKAIQADYRALSHKGDVPRVPLWLTGQPGRLHKLQMWQDLFLRRINSGQPQELLDQVYKGAAAVEAILDWLGGRQPAPDAGAGKTRAEPDLRADTDRVASSALSPTTSECVAEEDHLNRRRLIESLSRLLTEREDIEAFAIGLFGHWGSGKSSLVRLLEKRLQEAESSPDRSGPRVKIAVFNAWKNEKSDKLAAMLAQSVVDRLVEDLGPVRRLFTALKLAGRRQQGVALAADQAKRAWAWLGQWGALAVPLSLPFVVLAMAVVWLPRGEPSTWLTGGLAWLGASLMVARRLIQDQLTGWFRGLGVEKPWSLLRLPDYGEHRGLLGDIHRTLRHLCSLTLAGGADPKQGDYLLLVVDDLDRCTVPTVKEVLDAVRLVADIPRVVTLVAIDERMAFAAVEQHYQQFGHAGREPALVARDYLAKVLQVSVILPEVQDGDLGNFIDVALFKDVPDIDAAQSVQAGGQAPAADDGETGAKPLGENGDAGTGPGNPREAAVSDDGQRLSEARSDDSAQDRPKLTALPEERERFKELALAFGFSNPRLLWRLYMAWKLLKSLTLEDGYRMAEADPRMRLLFWCEWVLQQEAAKRPALDAWLAASQAGAWGDGLTEAIAQAMEPVRAQVSGGNPPSVFAPMKAVLLPTSPSNGATQGSTRSP